jgi:hypothetical protein
MEPGWASYSLSPNYTLTSWRGAEAGASTEFLDIHQLALPMYDPDNIRQICV